MDWLLAFKEKKLISYSVKSLTSLLMPQGSSAYRFLVFWALGGMKNTSGISLTER